MGNVNVIPMNESDAREISKWVYEVPYDIYNIGEEGIVELLAGNYYSVVEDNSKLICFFCNGKEAQVPGGDYVGNYIDIGLGVRPDLTGMGLGLKMVQLELDYFRTVTKERQFRLTVAAFNERAINVYKKVGFVIQSSFVNPKSNKQFYIMTLTL
jgi:[ribosomal protein S18]-alanine N-acetyltransferase